MPFRLRQVGKRGTSFFLVSLDSNGEKDQLVKLRKDKKCLDGRYGEGNRRRERGVLIGGT